jgi:hypothetical protein
MFTIVEAVAAVKVEPETPSKQVTVKVDWVVIGGVVMVVGFGLRLQDVGVRVWLMLEPEPVPVTVQDWLRPLPVTVRTVVLPEFTRVGDAVMLTVGLVQVPGPVGDGVTGQKPPVLVPFTTVPQLFVQVWPLQVLAAVQVPSGTQPVGGGA